MAFDYGNAFALLDNPFSPLGPLAGVKRKSLQNNLANNPLLINLEPALEPLYSQDAGLFGTYLENFQKFARRAGYREKPPPPRVGNSSFIFSIYGTEGTGKTTFAQILVSWLKQCKPGDSNWSVHDEWSLARIAEPAKQIERIDALQKKIQIDVSKNSYCCIVVDNIGPGVLTRALEMYDQLLCNWIVFLFLLSKESELFPALSNGGKRTIIPFRMRPLSANWAVAFVKHRINLFRDMTVKAPWMKTYPLFPFDEDDIRSAFDSNAILGLISEEDTVSLQQFSVILSGMLAERLDALDDDFNITVVPENDIQGHLLRLSTEYKRLVENKRLVANG